MRLGTAREGKGIDGVAHRLEAEKIGVGAGREEDVGPELRRRLDVEGQAAVRPGDAGAAVPADEAVVDPAVG